MTSASGGKEARKDEIAELARRRGFLWLAFEIYGGAAGFYDYGPLGALLKRRVEEAWRDFYSREGFYEVETTNIAPREIFEASGHLESFTDRAVVCKHCKSFFRVVEGVDVSEKCPECGKTRPILARFCPNCGNTVSHVRGIPCLETKCSKCGANMLPAD